MNIIERNYLHFDPPTKTYANKPEYKLYRSSSEVNYKLNTYLDPIYQYEYSEKPTNNSSLSSAGVFSLQKSKHFCESRRSSNNYSVPNNNDKIILKETINQNLLVPNVLHLESGVKSFRKIIPPSRNPQMNILRLSSFYESQDAPDYLKVYDKKGVDEINNYYAKNNQNLSVLSRFNNWITVTPKKRNRRFNLEKEKQDLHEVSKIAPDWMIKKHRTRPQNLFKAIQWKNTMKDKTKVTFLIDRNQKDVLPNYLIDAYRREKYPEQ